MGFFTKFFGPKETAATTAAESRNAGLTAALALQLRGDLPQALEAYQRIGTDNPDDNLAPFFAAATLTCMGKTAEAAQRLSDLSRRIATSGESISRAVSGDILPLIDGEPMLSISDVAKIIVTCGDHLKSGGFVPQSAVCFEIAAGLLPDEVHVLHKLGDTLHDLGAYEYAEEVLRTALELAPEHWGTLYTSAVLFQDLGRFGEALARYEMAVALNPDHVRCQNNYGAALLHTGQLDEALVHCTLAAQLDPGFPLARINLGNIYLQKQDYDTARSCFHEALALDEKLAPAYFGLGVVEQYAGGDRERSRDFYLKAIELNPDNPRFHEALANLLAGEVKA